MKRALLVAAALALAACQSEEPPPEQKPREGRAETQSIRNTQAIGYDGKAIADQVDKTLDANEQRVREQEKETSE